MNNDSLHQETITRQNRVLAPIILAVSIILAILVLRPFYIDTIEKNTIADRVQNDLEAKSGALAELQKIQVMVDSWTTSDLSKKVTQLSQVFDVPDIMQAVMLNDYTKSTLSSDAKIAIGSISVGKWTKLPNGLSLGQVSTTITGGDMYDVIDYITYLTTNSPYAFTIDSISLPLDTDPSKAYVNSGKFSLWLSLSMYYYE